MKRILLILTLMLPISAQAVTFNVNCDKPGPIGKISTYLKLVNAFDATTIKVSGTCHENIQINSLDRLSLIAVAGANLQDASSGAQPVILIHRFPTRDCPGFHDHWWRYGHQLREQKPLPFLLGYHQRGRQFRHLHRRLRSQLVE